MIDFSRRLNDLWFLSEPLLFSVLCTHKLTENNRIDIPLRTGQMKIEYNSKLLDDSSFEEIAELFKIEAIRILLKHPYQRIPYKARREALSLSSIITISENYNSYFNLPTAKDFDIPEKLAFEEYYKLLAVLFTKMRSGQDGNEGEEIDGSTESDNPLFSVLDRGNIGDSLEQYKQLSALWEEDNLSEITINNIIEQAKETGSWGSLPANVIHLIQASTIVKLDYRKILNSFRASVLSSNTTPTRMRPSRRYGFDYMGRKSEFTTKLLVAVDVSGSVTHENLQNFFSVVNRFFKYGISQMDIIQFDTEIKGEITSLKNAKKTIKIEGNGGTSFQCVFDFLCEKPTYDGLIIFTDGYSEIPELKHNLRTKFLWILDNENNYNKHKKWISSIPKSRAVWIE